MCEHKYILLESNKSCESQTYGYNKQWKRESVFFCEKCLDIQTKIQSSCQMDKPEWY